jgi:DNA-binding NarL/FixJ family response regulator
MTSRSHPDSAGRSVRAEVSPSQARRVLEEFASLPDPGRPHPAPFAILTARERDIVALLAEGLTNHEIAQRLVISSKTAKTHVSRAMRKLGVDHRARLVALAYQTGFVRPMRLVAGQSPGSLTHDGSRSTLS